MRSQETPLNQSVAIAIPDNINVETSENKTSCCMMTCVVMCIMIIGLPFIVADLYYSYSYADECLTQTIPDLLTLKNWLFVSGWTNLSFLSLALAAGICAVRTGMDTDNCLFMFFRLSFSIFQLVWLILGAIIFWKYLEPTSSCSGSLSAYMWTRLILGFVNVLMYCRGKKSE